MKRTAHTIAQKYGWVAMENLKLKNMTKSAKGTVEDPGRNVKQKSGLNRSLARVAPYGMRMAILWALFKAGGRLILADPKYTSQTCPKCGYTSSSNRPTQAHFGCQLCGCTENADVVGALNVLKKSRTGSVRPSSELGTSQQREPSFSSRPDANTRNPGYSYSGGCQTSEVGDAPNGRSGHSLKWNCLLQSLPVDAVDEVHAHDGAVLRAVEALEVEAVAVDRRKAREEGVDAGDALGRQGAADERGVPVDVP